jgi:peptide/nickel transport system substrate-binding protein/oligopeptide transport system substrate-binding protein
MLDSAIGWGARRSGAWHGTLGRCGRLALPLVGLLAFLLSACGTPAAGAGALAASQKFVYPFPGPSAVDDPNNPNVLDPAEIAAAEDNTTASMIYSGLVTLGPGLTVVNDSAKNIDITPDGKKYTFHLLPDLRFSDGTPITANDFAYAIDRALDPHLCDVTDANGNVTTAYGNSPYGPNCTYVGQTYLNHILGANDRINGSGGSDHSVVAQGDNPAKGISVIDPQTLVIRLDTAIGFFLEALTYPTSYPVEKSLVDKYPKGQWVYHLDEGGCSGPFKIKSYTDKKQIVFVPNPYWAADGRNGKSAQQLKLTISEVDRPFIASVDTSYDNYRGSQYDFTEVPGKDYAYARGQDDFHEVGALQIDYFGFNRLVPPFDNTAVRQAFALAINKQLLVDRIYNGGAIPTNHIVPEGMPGYFPDLLTPPPDRTQALTGNQTAAQALIKQAATGCTGDEQTDHDYCPYIDAAHYTALKEIDVNTNRSNQTRVDFVTAATQEWASVLQLNVQEKTVSLSNIISNTRVAKGASGYGAWAIGWLADYPDPQDFLSLQFRSNADQNGPHVNDPDLDQTFDKADALNDPTKVQQRMDLYNQAEQKLVDTVAWLPYLQKKVTWRQRFWVHGFGLNPVFIFPDIGWPSVYITAH